MNLLEFESQHVNNGEIKDYPKLLQSIFNSGLENDAVRKEVYPYLLSVRHPSLTHEEFQDFRAKKLQKYSGVQNFDPTA